jgi:predicted O-linked N-acetylglucosamine transferase (SPINDLY family)
MAEYEALALQLATDAALLAGIKAKLERHRGSHPLFDSRRFTRHVEIAFTQMWQRSQRGEPPASFAVEPVD